MKEIIREGTSRALNRQMLKAWPQLGSIHLAACASGDQMLQTGEGHEGTSEWQFCGGPPGSPGPSRRTAGACAPTAPKPFLE